MAFDPITAISNVANTILERVLPDKAAQDAAKLELAKMQLGGELAATAAQIEVDKQEAASNSTFVAGWRPFIGWISGSALAYQFILRPLLNFAAPLLATMFHAKTVMPVAPGLEMDSLMTLLLGMLGMGAMRTVEKVNGVPAQQTGH